MDGELADSFAPPRTEPDAHEAELDGLRRCCLLAGVAAWRYRVDGGRLSLSPECRSLLGLSPNEAVDGETVISLLPEQDRERLWQTSERAIAHGTAFEVELCVHRRDGAQRILTLRAAPEAGGYHGVVIDQTGRRSEHAPLRRPMQPAIVGDTPITDTSREPQSDRDALETSLATLRGVVDGIDQAVIATDPQGSITLFSRGAERMLGWSAEEMVGQRSVMALHLDVELTAQAMASGRSDADFAMLVEAAKQGRAGTVEWTYVRKNGRQLLASLSISALRGRNGDVDGYLFVARDVTAEHQAREAKRTQADRLMKLSHRLPGVLYQYERTLDGRWRFVWVSYRSIDIYGYTPEQLYANSALVSQRIHADDRQRIDESMQFSAETLSPWREQFRVTFDDGCVLWLQGDATPELQVDGSVVWHGYTSDITELKAFEAELVAAREQALDASRVKSQFLSNMSHEMRTPLNGIIGMSELLLEEDWDAEPRSLLENLRSSGRSLLSLINDILDLSRVESGRFELESVSFSVRDLLKRAEQTVALPAAEKGLSLRVDVDAGVPVAVMGDPARVLQVLVNLMGNAVKFTDRGEVSVRASFANERLSIGVVDTGIGITEAALARLFEPFTQADGSITRRFGGSGLGLAISRKLVEKMKGHLTVTSEEGKGTRFVMELPAATAVEAVAPKDSAATALSPAGPSLRVLVAEDNAINALLVRKILEREGHKVMHVVNGQEAVKAVSAGEFDLVLMDVQMPVMDGLEATRLIRQQTLRPLHICALTANAMKGDIERCTAAGMDDYLTKPVDIGGLRQRLHTLQRALISHAQAS